MTPAAIETLLDRIARMRLFALAVAALSMAATSTLPRPNIVAVTADSEAALAIDTNSIIHLPRSMVEARVFTVFGQQRGPADVGYVLAGTYEFECDKTPRLRALHQDLVNLDNLVVSHPQEPWTKLDFRFDHVSHTYNIYMAACAGRYPHRRGTDDYRTFRNEYLEMLNHGQIK